MSRRRWASRRWCWHPGRAWWRRALALIGGPCWHFTHWQGECPATWQRVWPDNPPPVVHREPHSPRRAG